MIYSLIVVDIGDNPDRIRPGRGWLNNIYAVHQRLHMAFPTEHQRERDPMFLLPFTPAGFKPEESGGSRPFLFRIERVIGMNAPSSMILVQSSVQPEWEYAFRNAPELLVAAPKVWEYDVRYRRGSKLQFRICMNLSKKSKYVSDGNGGQMELPVSKRMAFNWNPDRDRDEQIKEWFAEKAMQNGFQLESCQVENTGWVRGWKPLSAAGAQNSKTRTSHRLKHRSVMLNGVLKVTDPDTFRNAVQNGIGAAKAFGFGLLSVKQS